MNQTPTKNVIIIGGVSCDPTDNEHDANPYNFINPGCKLAKKLKDSVVLVHAKSYEIRAKNYPPEKEHRWVADTVEKRKNMPPDHFWKTIQKHVKDPIPIATAADLTKYLKPLQVHTISYFGHSNKSAMFLQYNTDGRSGGMVTWGVDQASELGLSIFNVASFLGKTPLFASFGCYQGEEGGLCQQLQEKWLAQTFGARGKTNYATIGQQKSYPSGKYYLYPLPVYQNQNLSFGSATQSSPDSLY